MLGVLDLQDSGVVEQQQPKVVLRARRRAFRLQFVGSGE